MARVFTLFPVLPDSLRLDKETSFISTTFRENAKNVRIKLQIRKIDAQSSIEKGEKYHYKIRRMLNVENK